MNAEYRDLVRRMAKEYWTPERRIGAQYIARDLVALINFLTEVEQHNKKVFLVDYILLFDFLYFPPVLDKQLLAFVMPP